MAITISTSYIVYDHSGTGVRHHHFTSQNTVHDFPPQTAAEDEAGNRIASAPDKYAFGQGPDLNFAFMSVNGAKDGNLLYTTAGDYPYHVGTQNINILAVYAPQSIGGPGGKPGIWVDAFNVNTGSLSDDINFITVSTPPANTIDAAKTFEANQEGDVSSVTPEYIMASASIDGGVPFVEWKEIMPPQSITTKRDFNLAQNETGEIWIAFYQSPNQPVYRVRDNALLWQWVDYATKVDGHGGPGDPGIILAPEVRDFTVGIALAKTAVDVDSSLSRELLSIAGKQINLASQAIQKKISGNIKG